MAYEQNPQLGAKPKENESIFFLRVLRVRLQPGVLISKDGRGYPGRRGWPVIILSYSACVPIQSQRKPVELGAASARW
jgi:hypothetical protein